MIFSEQPIYGRLTVPTPRASLWETIPPAVRTQLVPIFTTLFLVKAGQTTAELLVRLTKGTPFCAMGTVADRAACTPSSVAVADVQGVLLLLNFVVILWFARLGLKEALEKPGEIKLDAKLVGLGTAFATALELYDYATKAGVPERIVLALLVFLYVFVVPFFLVEGARAPAEASAETRSRSAAMQAQAAFDLLAYAVIPCVLAALAGGLYFVVLNEGASLLGHPLLSSTIDTIPRRALGRVEFWGFSPGFLGMGWLPAVLLVAVRRCSSVNGGGSSLSAAGKALILGATVVTGMLFAIALIGNDSLIPLAENHGSWPLRVAKAALAFAILAAFLAAFLGARLTRQLHPALALPLQVATFAAMGAATGGVLAGLRSYFMGSVEQAPTLIALHAGGFVVALLAGRLGLLLVERKIPELRPVLGREPEMPPPPSGTGVDALGFEGFRASR